MHSAMLATSVALLFEIVCAWDDSGFEHWFDDELEERRHSMLSFEGTVPNFISGTFVQTGAGRYTMGAMRFGHAFDGFGKIHSLHFRQDGTTDFSSVFVQSAFLNESLQKNEITAGITLGETDPPSRVKHGLQNAMGANDNNDVKALRLGDAEVVLSDTTVLSRQASDFTMFAGNIKPAMGNFPGEAFRDHIVPAAHICMQGPLAHGQVDPETGVFTAAMGCMSPIGPLLEGYHVIFSIEPSMVNRRKLLAKIPLPRGRGPSYMHSMAFTPNHLVLIAEPMHMSTSEVLKGTPLGLGGIFLGNGTIFQVMNRKTGIVREYHVPSFLFVHIVNAWEEFGDIIIDLTWYTMDSFSMFHLFQFKVLRDKAARDAWPLGQIRRFRLQSDGAVVETVLLPAENKTWFELPKTNNAVQGKPYCIFYGFQIHAYRYDQDQSSMDAGPFGAAAIGKRNLCTGERMGWYGVNEFPGEVEFIPDPKGTAEDDGVLVGMVFDGNSNSSYVQILDAKNMTRLAKASLPVRVPFSVHASFFPSDSPSASPHFKELIV